MDGMRIFYCSCATNAVETHSSRAFSFYLLRLLAYPIREVGSPSEQVSSACLSGCSYRRVLAPHARAGIDTGVNLTGQIPGPRQYSRPCGGLPRLLDQGSRGRRSACSWHERRRRARGRVHRPIRARSPIKRGGSSSSSISQQQHGGRRGGINARRRRPARWG